MPATLPSQDVGLAAAQIERSCRIERVRQLKPQVAAASPETVRSILEEAARFADAHLEPVRESLDRACPAFGMLPVQQRSAARLIAAYGDQAKRAERLPPLAAGRWGATICVSEPAAGSDLGRIRTRARANGDGTWSVFGEKCWISYGDHDLTPRIGHCLLACIAEASAGGAGGLSLTTFEGTTGIQALDLLWRRLLEARSSRSRTFGHQARAAIRRVSDCVFLGIA